MWVDVNISVKKVKKRGGYYKYEVRSRLRRNGLGERVPLMKYSMPLVMEVGNSVQASGCQLSSHERNLNSLST